MLIKADKLCAEDTMESSEQLPGRLCSEFVLNETYKTIVTSNKRSFSVT